MKCLIFHDPTSVKHENATSSSPQGGDEGNDFTIKCKILSFENAFSVRKTLEAARNFTRNPRMSKRNKCLSATSGFLSFLSLCELPVNYIRSGSQVRTTRLQTILSCTDNFANGGEHWWVDLDPGRSHRILSSLLLILP